MATSNNLLCVTQRSCQDNNERTDGKQTLAIFLKLKTKNVRNQWKRLFVVAEWCCRWFYCCAFLWGNFLAICSFCGRQKNQLPCWCQMKASYVMENGNIWIFWRRRPLRIRVFQLEQNDMCSLNGRVVFIFGEMGGDCFVSGLYNFQISQLRRTSLFKC